VDEQPKDDKGVHPGDKSYFTTTSTSSSSSSSSSRSNNAKLTHHHCNALERRRADSAAAFRAEVASVLNLRHQNWTLADVDSALGLQLPPGISTSSASTSSDESNSSSSRGDNYYIDQSGPGGEPFGLCGDLRAPVPKVPRVVEDGGEGDWTVLVVGLDFGMAPLWDDKDQATRSTSEATLDDSNAFFSELPMNQSPLFRNASHWRYQDYILRDLLGGLVGRYYDACSAYKLPLHNVGGSILLQECYRNKIHAHACNAVCLQILSKHPLVVFCCSSIITLFAFFWHAQWRRCARVR